ncbi:carboxymuconolactone decarboxylase family protein [Rhizobium sp. Root1220]|uniref:carboxymuconolactone decarboxylase family protein n=1 Tax=Rhizobium sp. Root1220 TaxID=1736432 RepID=UPI000701ABB6|nr:carboxymuconolactone decarboxylase family protein [Rhizobium sp. Root1220]KQV79596.1 alkylhydroperoxidase [Rhizobium sp. Root1220]
MKERLDCARASPEGLRAFWEVYAAVANGSLDRPLLSLVYLRVSQINGCPYYIDVHSQELLNMGMTVEKLGQVPVWRNAGPLFNARERSGLAWAEIVTRVVETRVPDVDYEAATAEFNDKELSDLTYAVGLMNALNRIGIAFRLKPAAAGTD